MKIRKPLVALAATVALVAPTPASAEPSPDRHYPKAHENIVAVDYDTCATDGLIRQCRLTSAQWVTLDEDPNTWHLATGVWSIDAPEAAVWLRVRLVFEGRTILVAPGTTGGPSAVIEHPDGTGTGYNIIEGAVMTRPEFRTALEVLAG